MRGERRAQAMVDGMRSLALHRVTTITSDFDILKHFWNSIFLGSMVKYCRGADHVCFVNAIRERRNI
jgi:hypothetical protein